MSEAPVVRLERDGEIGVIIVNYPPVNALGPGVSEGIIDSLNKANADPSIKAMVLMGDGRSFIAGADIPRGSARGRKRLAIGERTYDVMDASKKPVVAAIHGFALGGGLENAMACHYRIAVAVGEGGIAGGADRYPAGWRWDAAAASPGRGEDGAGDDYLRATYVPAPEKPLAKLGILDEVLPEGANLREISRWHALARLPMSGRCRGCTRQGMATAEPGVFDAIRKSIARKARNQKAPYNCIAAVEASCTLSFDEGIRREAELFAELETADEAKALRYAFFAEREVAKLPDLPSVVAPADFTAPAVIGAGTMGGGIAMSFADFGYDVKIMDATQDALDRGMERIRNNYATSVKRGSLAEDEMQRRVARIHPVAGLEDIKDCDVVVEAVFERMDVKKPIFEKLDEVMKAGSISLFSNTSALRIWMTRPR